jgi:biopolymer transport protein ExbB/TolQ
MSTNTPPPLPPDFNASAEPSSKLPFLAAKAAVTLPAFLFLMGMVFSTWRKTAGEELPRSVQLFQGGIAVALLLAGLIAAIIALASVPRYGRNGLLGRGLSGLFLNGIFLVLFVFGFQKARSNAQQVKTELARLQTANQEVRESMRKELDEKGVIESGDAQLKRLENQFKEASDKLSGPDKLIMESSAAYAQTMQAEMKKYNAAVEAFQSAEVLNVKAIDSREQIAAKRVVVQKFVDVNTQLTTFLKQASQIYEKELRERKLSESTLKEVMRGFNRSVEARQPLLMEIRGCDDRLGKAALGTLDLLDKQFGKWRFDSSVNQVIFEDDEALERYNGFLDVINKAAEDQVAAQEKLLSIKI